MIKIYKLENSPIKEIASSYKIFDILSNKASKTLSIVKSQAKNHYEITKNVADDRAYYVLSGKLVINGSICVPGDIIYIPKNTEYQFEGTFEALIIDTPAFNEKYDVTKVSGPKK